MLECLLQSMVWLGIFVVPLDCVWQTTWGVILGEVLWRVSMRTGDAGFAWELQKKSKKRQLSY